MSTSLRAFHNDPKIKRKYLSRVRAHRKADEIIKGQYWQDGKGCAVGCTVHSDEHSAYETELGIPEWLAILEDTLFEGVSTEYSKTWPENFLKSINIGADLETIKSTFLIYVLEDALKVFDHRRYPSVKRSIINVISLYRNINHKTEELRAAAIDTYIDYIGVLPYGSNAVRMAAYAAYTAACYVYGSSSAVTATADAIAADVATVTVYEQVPYVSVSDAVSHVKQLAYARYADKLLELLKACK